MKSEKEEQIARGVRHILEAIDPDSGREGLVDTPERVARAWLELTRGYSEDPAKILARRFEEPCDQLVVAGPIDFDSTCEHHLLSFRGVAFVGYLPSEGRVVGLSKLPRLVDCYARRLQIQERMTREIAAAIAEHLQPKGWGVVVYARHLCTCARGVKKPRVVMSTAALGGCILNEPASRAEFDKRVETQLGLAGIGGI